MANNYKLNTANSFYPSTVYWKRFTVGLETFSPVEGEREEVRLNIGLEGLSSLQRLTSGNARALQTVFVTVFSSLVRRFFSDRLICKICPGQPNILLYPFNDNICRDLKVSLLGVKEVFLEAVKHSGYDRDQISLDSFADCTLSFAVPPLRSSFDSFELNVELTGDQISLTLLYNQYRIEPYLAHHFISYFSHVLTHLEVFFNGEQSLNDFLITEDKEMIASMNSTAHIYPENQTIVTIFEHRVSVCPNAIAIWHGGGHLTYKDFNERANKFCDFLIREYDIGSGDIVGLNLSRSEQMVICIFGILKSGAAYMPIDLKLPQVRKDFIIEDSGARLVVNDQLMDSFNTVAYEFSPSNPTGKPDASDLAYVIYTSGSTGNPKGVMLEHGGLVNRLFWMQDSYSLTEKDVLIQKTNYAFDVSVWEMFWWSQFGASLYIPLEGVEKDPQELMESIRQENITVIHFVPSMLAVFLDYLYKDKGMLASLASLKQVYVSGEALPNKVRDDFFRLLPDISLMNLYGPTEATIDVTYFDCGKDVVGSGSIPIGKPIWNTKIHILDGHHCEVPVGAIGNLYIESVGLARGYLNRGDLTAEKFIDSPLFSSRIYNSGDLARWLPDGNIEFIGRSDFQVKIRGNRVELGDIENTMLSYSGDISQAIVTGTEKNGDQVLTGYYTVRGNSVDRSGLRAFLQERLSEYMIPTYLIELDSIPLTANGKVDRKELPSVTAEGLIRREYIAPRNTTEETLVGIWEEVLGVEKVGITDNFFELGGHSLIVGQVLNKIRQKLSQGISFKDFFSTPTIDEIFKKLSRKEYRPISKVPDQENYPLTPSQQRLWVLSQLTGGSQAYNMPAVVTLKGNLEPKFLEYAFRYFINRHEILRTEFRTDARLGEVRQYIVPKNKIDFSIDVVDLTGKGQNEIDEWLQNANSMAFDFAKAPLIKAFLLKVADNEHLMFLLMHHLIGDGWSLQVLISEIVENYNNLVNRVDIDSNGSTLPVQYRDYAMWLEEEKKQERYKVAESYWLDQFKGKLPVLNLPSYRVRPLIQTYNGNHLQHVFSEEFTFRLNAFCQRHGVTMFMALMAGINGLLYRYTREEDIIVGTPVAGREHPDLENQIGLYLNTLAIRTKFDGQRRDSFASLLQRVKESLLSAYEHQCYSFNELVDKLGVRRDRSRSALFDVLVVLQNQSQLQLGLDKHDLEGIQVERYDFPRNTSQFDISYNFLEEDGRLTLTIGYNTDIYDRFFIDQMFGHFENLLNASFENDEIDIREIDILTSHERQRLLGEFSDNRIEYPKNISVVELFEQQAMKSPKNIAVVFEGVEISYRELNHRSNKLGDYLRTNFSVNETSLVAIKLESGPRLIEAVLGILKSGAGYVPIDPESPMDRVDYILKDTRAKTVIDEDFLIAFDSNAVYCRQTNLLKYSHPESLAYVIYTSGSTGQPKGVKINSLNILDYFYGLKNEINLTEVNSYGMMSTIATDLGNTVLFSSLFEGKTLHLFTKDQLRDFDYIKQYFNKHSIDCIKIVPSYWKALNLDDDFKSPCKKIIFGGEALGPEIITRLHSIRPEIQIVNHYGPTETTIGKTLSIIGSHYTGEQVPIGKAFSNTSLFVVDEKMQLVPIAVSGELLIGGDGVSEGYLNNPSLTAQKFIVFNGIKVYKTGDIVRWLPDGLIEFLGRKDFQVKIRGYRIELGDVENAVLNYGSGIYQCVVVSNTADANVDKLTAYYTSRELAIDKRNLKEFLHKSLPEYMVPTYFIQLESFPLTSNGKIDRRCLPEVSNENLIKGVYIQPTNETEKRLTEIWQEILGVPKIGITDNFFDLGGNSLMVAQVINRVNREISLSIDFKTFFDHPTIRDYVRLARKSYYHPIQSCKEEDSYPLSPSQERIWILSQLEEGSKAYNMSAAFKIVGDIQILVLEESFVDLIRKYEILRTVFKAEANGAIKQIVSPFTDIDFKISTVDFQNKAEFDIQDYLKDLNQVVFDLEKDVLVRVVLIKLKKNNILFVSMHHIISDGWSTELLMSKAVEYYNKRVQMEINFQNEVFPKIQYRDYCIWFDGIKESEEYKVAENYWLSRFSDDVPALEIPTFKTRPKVHRYKGNQINHTFKKEFLQKLHAFCEREKLSLFMVLMTSVRFLLYRYTGCNDLTIGTPIAGRDHPDLEDQLGLFLNTLAIRLDLQPGETIESILYKEKENLLNAYEHRLFPFDELVRKLNLNRDSNRSPLFDVVVVLQNQKQLNTGLKKQDFVGLDIEKYNFQKGTSHFDLSFIFSVEESLLNLTLEYNSDIYTDYQMSRTIAHLENTLNNVLTDKTQIIDDVDYLTEEERHQLLYEFNNTCVEYPEEKTIIDLFEEQVKKTPDAIAVVFEGREVSYDALNSRANQIAKYLVNNYAIQADDLIAIKLDRSDHFVESILGVLKSGAAYVPIDPSYPIERVQYILEDAKVKAIIDNELLNSFNRIGEMNMSENLSRKIERNNLAYVIYTSGTTGRPKGVMIEHRGIVNTIQSLINKDVFKKSDYCLQFANQCFDASIWEILGALLCGAKLFVVTESTKNDTNVFIDFMNANNISNAILTPAYVNLLDIHRMTSLKTLITGGENAPYEKALPFSQKHKYINAYGPTESSICATLFQGSFDSIIPIGSPIDNTQVYILGQNSNQLQSIGVIGELCISGVGLARGYLNQPELTKDKFLVHPYIIGERLYRTGDLARWLPEGNIEFFGRKDSQVKLRGYRIELGEIEYALKLQKDILQAVVNVLEINGHRCLVGYIVSDLSIDKKSVKQSLRQHLPEYMVPDYFKQVMTIPLSTNGKVDKNLLPEVSVDDFVENSYLAPNSETEKTLESLWREVLGLERIGINENFFSLGGNSLKLIQLNTRIKETYKIDLRISDIIEDLCIESLAKRIDDRAEENITICKSALQDSYPLTPLQEKIWYACQVDSRETTYNIVIPIIESKPLDNSSFRGKVLNLIQKYRILRLFFKDNSGKIIQKVGTRTEIDSILYWEEHNGDDLAFHSRLQHIEKAEQGHKFNLESPGLFRVHVLNSIGRSAIIINIHHLISDQSSITILRNELLGQISVEKDENAIDFLDYSVWLDNHLNNKVGSFNKEIIQEINNVEYCELPIVKSGFNQFNFMPEMSADNRIDIDDVHILDFCKRLEVSPFSFWMFAWGVTLVLVAKEKSIVISSPLNVRSHQHLRNQPGLFLDTLQLAFHVNKDAKIGIAIKDCFNRILNGVDNLFPLDKILTADQKRILDNYFIIYNEIEPNDALNIQKSNALGKFSLALIVNKVDQKFTFNIQYNSAQYLDTEIELLAARFINVCKQIIADEQGLVADLSILLEKEKEYKSLKSEFIF